MSVSRDRAISVSAVPKAYCWLCLCSAIQRDWGCLPFTLSWSRSLLTERHRNDANAEIIRPPQGIWPRYKSRRSVTFARVVRGTFSDAYSPPPEGCGHLSWLLRQDVFAGVRSGLCSPESSTNSLGSLLDIGVLWEFGSPRGSSWHAIPT